MSKEKYYIAKKYGDMLHIYDPVFRVNYWYQTIRDFKKAEKLLKRLDIKHEFNRENQGGFTVYEKFGQEICIMWTKGQDSDIVHECCHAANYILEKAGININKETDEIHAYYVSFLFKIIKKYSR